MKSKQIESGPLFILLVVLASCGQPLPESIEIAYNALPEEVDFNFHIRPILSDRCYKCHGPDDNTREAGLRLDLEDEAFARLKESSRFALKAGQPEQSEVWNRILSEDPKYQMPPADSHLKLDPREKALIYKWIADGAHWKEHWAFAPPSRPDIPPANSMDSKNEIDRFISAKLLEQNLVGSSPAAPERLIRRLYFDLTGLPPTPKELDNFCRDYSASTYEKLVDYLLTTDAYAERMAMEWLDVARYGDTQGMHWDSERYSWPWRDWVIKAFKENKPYDEFILEQMAGDLLPNATRDQKLATSFHRNNPTTSEGGVAGEEFRQKYVQDRTNTTATAFLGLTLECATCHDHKFDPISQEEYFQMTAFFNNLKEVGMVNEFLVHPDGGPVTSSGPVLSLPDSSTASKLSMLDDQIEELRIDLEDAEDLPATIDFLKALDGNEISVPESDFHFPFESIASFLINDAVIHRIQNLDPINQRVDGNSGSLACGKPQVVQGVIGSALRSEDEMDLVFLKKAGTFEVNEPYSASVWIKTEKSDANQSILGTSGEMGNAWRGWDFSIDTANRPLIKLACFEPHNYMQITGVERIEKDEWQHLAFTYNGLGKAEGLALYLNGRKIQSEITYDNLYGSIIHRWNSERKEWPERPIMVFRSGRYHTGESGVFKGSIDEINIYKRWLSELEVEAIYTHQSGATSTNVNEKTVQQHLLNKHGETYQSLQEDLRGLIGKRISFYPEIPEIMVMQDMATARPTFVLDRGQYDAPTKQVYPGTPGHILEFKQDLPANRLGLAKWILDPENPLTARVAVNRYWQMIFGQGIVDTPHDFGTQGSLPSHPELLDWLAIEFMDSGWNVRHLLKLMVMSNTYQQSSEIKEQHQKKDPKNIYLARAPSYRLQAEMIRDNALAASGLLNRKVGGASVKPYQPEGIWSYSILASGKYEESVGDDLYRRSLYSYLRRTAPHPAMTAFDAPNRLVCTTKRELTNTPLQALVLLNDPQFVEASRVLGDRMISEGGEDFQSRMAYGFRLLCGRNPLPGEMKLLEKQYLLARSKFGEMEGSANQLMSVGRKNPKPTADPIETAAYALVANTMMNFDEAYMKR